MRNTGFNILKPYFQYLSDPHTAPCHQFENQPIPGIIGFEYEFIHNVLFQDCPLPAFGKPESFA